MYTIYMVPIRELDIAERLHIIGVCTCHSKLAVVNISVYYLADRGLQVSLKIKICCSVFTGTPNSVRYFTLARLEFSSLLKYTNMKTSVSYLL